MKNDIVIIGGGIMGSAAAYFLARSGNAGSVTVIEPDPSYSKATTPQGAGGIRQQFSIPENVQMSSFSLDFYKNFASHMSDIPDIEDIGFREQGYLFVVTESGEKQLRINQELQSSLGVNAQLMGHDELIRKFPSISRQDITLSCYTPDDGWIDPYTALLNFKSAAEHLGVTYIKDRVVSMNADKSAVTSVELETGKTVKGNFFINTAGPWVRQISQMTGADLPIVPMCRVQNFWKCPHEFEPLPLVKDESGMFFRPEGDGFAGGCPSFDVAPGFIEDVYKGFFANYFEDVVWPMMAALVPKFEDLRSESMWGGHYAQNSLDGNMIIGQYSPGHQNIITACGFSGHGIMHAPAVGRALAELALTGRYQTIDLTKLQIDRVHTNTPYAEKGIK